LHVTGNDEERREKPGDSEEKIEGRGVFYGKKGLQSRPCAYSQETTRAKKGLELEKSKRYSSGASFILEKIKIWVQIGKGKVKEKKGKTVKRARGGQSG